MLVISKPPESCTFLAACGEELVVRFGVRGLKKAFHTATAFGKTFLCRMLLNQDILYGWDNHASYLADCAGVELTL